jgi:uncharacterized protein (DUF433 family)
MVSLSLRAEPVPIHINAHGVALIANTRVTLDTVVIAFRQGATAEEIAQRFPSLTLSDVYSVIAYYLRSQAEVDAYVDERLRKADAVRQEYEARFDPTGIRERLLARRKSQE